MNTDNRRFQSINRGTNQVVKRLKLHEIMNRMRLDHEIIRRLQLHRRPEVAETERYCTAVVYVTRIPQQSHPRIRSVLYNPRFLLHFFLFFFPFPLSVNIPGQKQTEQIEKFCFWKSKSKWTRSRRKRREREYLYMWSSPASMWDPTNGWIKAVSGGYTSASWGWMV